MKMGTILFYALCVVAFSCFFLCAVDLAYNKNFNMSENLSSGLTLLVSLLVLIMVCPLVSGDAASINNTNSTLLNRLNDALSEAIPFYDYLATSQDGIGLLQMLSNNNENNPNVQYQYFAQEFLQTVFMASVIPLVNHLLPSTIVEVGKFNRIIMQIAVNILVVAVTMVLYYFFQKTAISAVILNVIIIACTTTPFVLLIKKLLFKSSAEILILILAAKFFGKAIIVTVLYMIFLNEIMLQKAELVYGFNSFMVVLPSIMVCGIMIFGIGICIRSIFS